MSFIKKAYLSGILGLGLMVACGLVAHAESLEEMTALAKKNDARYLAARAEYTAKTFQSDQALSRLLPTLEASGDLGKNHLKSTYDNHRFTALDRDFESNRWSAELIQPIVRMDAWMGLARSQKVNAYALCNLRLAESDLVLRLAQAYYDVLLAQESVGFLEAEKRTLTEQWQSAKGMHSSGAVAGTEPMQIQARLSLIVAQLLEAQWELANKRRVLESIAGEETVDPDPVPESELDKSLGSLDDWLARVPENYQVRSARMSLEVAQGSQWQSASGFWPSIDAVGTYGDAHQGPTAAFPVETNDKSYSASLRCTWVLFSGWGTVAECREAQKNTEKAQYDLLAAEREAGIQIAEAYSGVCSGLEQMKALHQGVAAATEVMHAMEKGYTVGARTLAQVLDARQQLLDAKRSCSQAFYKLLLNQRKLYLAVSEFEEVL